MTSQKWKTAQVTEELEATPVGSGWWAVRPPGVLGTCGWINRVAWSARYVHAKSAKEAVEIVLERSTNAEPV